MTPTTAAPPRQPAADPFAIGWRDVRRELADGSTVIEQIPLTLEDALHPQEGDTIVQNTVHDRNLAYLREVAHLQTTDEPHTLVLCDCKVLWEDGEHHSPDLAIIPDVADPAVRRTEFNVAVEGTRPQVIMEVVSPTTRSNDVETKLAHYYHYRVPVYVIVDQADDDAPLELIGYRRSRRRYARIAPEADGRLAVPELGILLGVQDDRVVAYDEATGEEIGDYVAVSDALAAEQARAEAAEGRAKAVETLANEQTRLAADERARADAAAQRVRQLEAELLRLQNPPLP